MTDFKMTLRGMDDAQAQVARIERGLKALQNYKSIVYSALPYAYGIHEGRHRVSGKIARKAGGAQYIRRAIDVVLSDADRDLAEGLNKVTAPGVWVVRRLALWARRLARKNAKQLTSREPKSHNYRLWRSIKHEVKRR